MKETDDNSNSHGCLCFFLGLVFGPIGLVVAAIIGKAKGVVSALLGMATGILIVVLLILFAALISPIHLTL